MQMVLKVLALAILGVLFQIGFEATVAVTSYPTQFSLTSFGEEESNAVEAAQRHFRESHALSRWFVIDVLAMPYFPADQL